MGEKHKVSRKSGANWKNEQKKLGNPHKRSKANKERPNKKRRLERQKVLAEQRKNQWKCPKCRNWNAVESGECEKCHEPKYVEEKPPAIKSEWGGQWKKVD